MYDLLESAGVSEAWLRLRLRLRLLKRVQGSNLYSSRATLPSPSAGIVSFS